MKILDFLLKEKHDNFSFIAEQAKRLLPAANILATSSFASFLDKYPHLSKVSLQDWDFSVTVAATCSALMSLAYIVPSESAYNRFTAILSKEMSDWNSKAEYAMGDLMRYLHKTWPKAQQLECEAATRLFAAITGSWCMVNCGLSVPREEPDELAVEVGMYILVSFKDWWTPPIRTDEER